MTGSVCRGRFTVEDEHLPAPEKTQQTHIHTHTCSQRNPGIHIEGRKLIQCWTSATRTSWKLTHACNTTASHSVPDFAAYIYHHVFSQILLINSSRLLYPTIQKPKFTTMSEVNAGNVLINNNYALVIKLITEVDLVRIYVFSHTKNITWNLPNTLGKPNIFNVILAKNSSHY